MLHWLAIPRLWQAVLLSGCLMTGLGCTPDVAPPTADTPPATDATASSSAGQPTQVAPSDFPTSAQPWLTADQLPWEASYVQYFSGKRIGFSVLSIEPSAFAETQQIVIHRRDVVDTSRDGQSVRLESEIEAVERNNGELVNFSLTSTDGESTTILEGKLRSRQLLLTKKSADSTQQTNLDYPEGAWGLLGLQAMLLRSPMQVGERRTAKLFLPTLNEIAQVELRAGAAELTPLPDGQAPSLVPVEVSMATSSSSLLSRHWIDSSGLIRKSLTLTGPSLTTFHVERRVTRELELALQVDKLQGKSIPVTGNAALTAAATVASYVVRTEGIDPYSFLLQSPRQQVESLEPRAAKVTLRADVPTAAADDPSTTDDLAANDLIDHQAPSIASLASEWAGDTNQASQVASRLEQHLFQAMQKQSSLNSRPSRASEAAAQASGDCLSHAIVLTALLRNRGIPARIVGGLVRAQPDAPTFEFHVWCEAWIDPGWVSLDAMFPADAKVERIGFRRSSLADADAYAAILPVLEPMQRIESIELLDGSQ